MLAHHSYRHPLSTNSTQTNSPSQNQRIPYSNIVQSSQRRSQNPPLSYISSDPLYQMNQHTTYNPTQISPTEDMAQSVLPPPQYIPIQQDTFINTAASIPEPVKPFDGLDHSYTPEDIDLALNHKEIPLDDIITHKHPSKPRYYRSRSRSPSQNRQQNRINQVNVESTNDKGSTKVEVHTYQITEIANTMTPYSWFYARYIHASEKKDNILPSNLEVLFLLDTGASISVLNLPTFHVIAKQLNLNVPKDIERNRAKTLTVANQTDVPIVHYVCFDDMISRSKSPKSIFQY